MSRLSRHSADAQITLRVLEFLGIKFVARADGIDTVLNPKSSRLLYGIKSAMNEEFLRDLADKTWRGLEGRARHGYSAGGLAYGYRSQPVRDDRGQVLGRKHVRWQPEEPTVIRIFRLFVGDEGDRPHSAREIAHIEQRAHRAAGGAVARSHRPSVHDVEIHGDHGAPQAAQGDSS